MELLADIPASPVLLITFNRPDYTKKVFEKIREAKVKKLFVANDAPREGNDRDAKARAEIKEIISNVDWDCELHINFQDKNLGCGMGPVSAITWAFQNEDKLIILEDDCVPSIYFFSYCNHCLEKYKDDTRIWLISGRSHQQGSRFFNDKDYLFSHYGHSWGWATWKRCWLQFDMTMGDFPEFLKDGGAINVLPTKKQGNLYNRVLSKCYYDKSLYTHAWDFQFGYTILKNGGLSIVPAKNLINNIGIIGTHSRKETVFHKIKVEDYYIITKEPKFVVANKEYEELHFNSHIKKILGGVSYLQKVINKGNKILKRICRF